MKRTGNLAIAVLGLFLAQVALAKVEATLDRYQAALGDTLSLTITVTENDENLADIDTAQVSRDFEILNKSTRSSTQIINGQRTHERQLILNITPLRTGSLSIGAFRSGNSSSAPLTIEVSEPVEIDPGAETVLFEAELDRESVYVQGQLILTLRLQQAVNLNQRSISELQLDDAFVLPLEQRSFQRNAGGRPWLVHEVRYAIFPEQSGTLRIPAQSFSAREGSRLRGRLVRMNTPALSVDVLPRPANYPLGATWLPARDLKIEEQWSSDPQQLTAGSSITRSIRLVAEGMQGAQLPPVASTPVDGIKLFPDQPVIGDSEIASGKRGVRTDSAALVATRAGSFTLPEIRIPWWDIEAEQLRYAVVPARTIDVTSSGSPALGNSAATKPSAPVSADQQRDPANPFWQWLAALCAIGWATTALLWWRARKPSQPDVAGHTDSPRLGKSYKSLLAACSANQANQARHWLQQWAGAINPALEGSALADVARQFDDELLTQEIALLDQQLYSANTGAWDGSVLALSVKRLHKSRKKGGKATNDLPPLYPGK
ncbi:protein BatD [Halioglobus maricola]|uniref:Protein BatD n=1 Tax=Halioglobus maricola TaxID=2601894 RepID=A0A5P9NLM0_9GAMM|nr:BatD family protein [Halioglobus maricola]QFU76396.1 protein BatD [Halioglobus maricola]